MDLAEVKTQIEEHRRKAKALRRKADDEDRKADALRAEAAKLATPLLEPIANPLKEGQHFPELGYSEEYKRIHGKDS